MKKKVLIGAGVAIGGFLLSMQGAYSHDGMMFKGQKSAEVQAIACSSAQESSRANASNYVLRSGKTVKFIKWKRQACDCSLIGSQDGHTDKWSCEAVGIFKGR